jgi:hypothetical protein
MNNKLGKLCLVTMLVLGLALAGAGQSAPPVVRLLLIDQTKTFTSTMKVAGTIGALRQTGMFAISVRLGDLVSDFDDPLAGEAPAPEQAPFDLVLILPRGLDTKTNVSIWLVSDGLHSLSPLVRGAVDLLCAIVDQVFASSGRIVDVSEDLWPGFLWASYVSKGWIR